MLECRAARSYVKFYAKKLCLRFSIMLTEHDDLLRRCPMLGNEVPFSYCRQPGQEIPCRKIFDCWWEAIDIRKFVEENYSEEVRNVMNQPPKPKTLSILELVVQARRRNSER
jgi:hypothetical protein